MEPTESELEQHFSALHDAPLLAVAAKRDDLTGRARHVVEEELQRRRLAMPELEPAAPTEVFEGQNQQWVTVERFRDLSSAIVARSALEAAEIDCYLRDENTVRMDWQISNFIGGMRLQVPQRDAEAASEVLAGLALDDLPEEDAATAPDNDVCPQCGSPDLHRKYRFGVLSLAAVLILGIPAPQGKRRWTCNDCNATWVDNDRE